MLQHRKIVKKFLVYFTALLFFAKTLTLLALEVKMLQDAARKKIKLLYSLLPARVTHIFSSY